MEVATLPVFPGFVPFKSSCRSSFNNFRAGGKVQFQSSIEKSMGMNKITRFLNVGFSHMLKSGPPCVQYVT